MSQTITIATLVNAPISLVWNSFINPSDVMCWNYASEDWHTPTAQNDLREGGRFDYRMEAKNKKNGFNFSGFYTKIIPYSLIEYELDDKRQVSNLFSSAKSGITVEITFETDNTYTTEQQREGWQSILDNFKKHVESRKTGNQTQRIRPCLWFDNEAEEAVKFYTSVFKDSEYAEVLYYTETNYDVPHGHKAGDILTIDFRLNEQWFTAINGGPTFKFNEAMSLQILCETQAEIDYYWQKLTEEGEEVECGWLKDKFGISWQVVPAILYELMQEPKRAARITEAYLKMKKIDIDTILKA